MIKTAVMVPCIRRVCIHNRITSCKFLEHIAIVGPYRLMCATRDSGSEVPVKPLNVDSSDILAPVTLNLREQMAFYDPFFIARSNRLGELLADSVHYIASGTEECSHEYVPKFSREFSCRSCKEIEFKCLCIRKVSSPEVTESGHQRRAVEVVARQAMNDLLKGGTQCFIGAR